MPHAMCRHVHELLLLVVIPRARVFPQMQLTTLDDPAGEVHSWFCLLANSNGSAGLDARF